MEEYVQMVLNLAKCQSIDEAKITHGGLLEHSHQEIVSYPILPSQKATLSIIPYHFTIFPTSQLLFYNTAH